MPRYRRASVPGGTYFFTLVTHGRKRILAADIGRSCLRRAFDETREQLPFEIVALCLLPDHLHCVWRLPSDDTDFSKRWARIKSLFSRYHRRESNIASSACPSRRRRREVQTWQRRFWEHLIRDEEDLRRHVDYIHYNPVKHGLVRNVRDWQWSTFHRYVRDGAYDVDWGGGVADLANAGE